MINELALFAGAGGSILAGKMLGWRTVCAVESDPYCQSVLLARQEDGILDPFPIWTDVRSFDGRPWNGIVDILTAGFPCQPFSVAGKRRGESDERNLWPDTIRILREVGPRYALLENVPGLLTHEYARTIFGELAEAGFDAEWDVLCAAEVGAHFVGDRLWIRCQNQNAEASSIRRASGGALPFRTWRDEQFKRLVLEQEQVSVPAGSRGGISDGVANRMDRLKALGNGWVPQVAVRAWGDLTGVVGKEGEANGNR